MSASCFRVGIGLGGAEKRREEDTGDDEEREPDQGELCASAGKGAGNPGTDKRSPVQATAGRRGWGRCPG